MSHLSIPGATRDTSSPQTSATTNATRLVIGGLGVTFVVVVATSYWCYRMIRPGDSLFGPTAIAVLTMGIVAVAWYVALHALGGPKWRRTLGVAIAVLCLAPAVWTFFGALPWSIASDRAATRTSLATIATGRSGCHLVRTGAAGLLRAPYQVCSSNPGDGYLVTFSALDSSRGYAYVQRRLDLSWFPDECALHLEGHWWAFNTSVNPSRGDSCPFGLTVQGGA